MVFFNFFSLSIFLKCHRFCLFFVLLFPGAVISLTAENQPAFKSKPVELVQSKKLLFLPFYNETGDKNFAWLETNIGDSLHDAARKKYSYEKISDEDFQRYFVRKGYAPSDLYNFDKILKIAKDCGADGVIFGVFTKNSLSAGKEQKNMITLTGKILSVIDGEIVGAKTVEMPVSPEMFSAVEEVSSALGENIKNLFFPSDRDALKRAAIFPGWGHHYKQQSTWGYVWGGLFWSAVGFTALSTVQYLRYTVEYKNFSPDHVKNNDGSTFIKNEAGATSQFRSLVSGAETYGQMTVGGLIAVGLIYAGNLLHAYLLRPNIGASADFSGVDRARLNLPLVTAGITPGQRELRGEISLVWGF